MDRITLKNYRCFREEQSARLAPLTLLVGDNSTGKTSFLAMIRALWILANEWRWPDFKEDPYDLGSFEEIAHHRGSRGGRSDTFDASLTMTTGTERLYRSVTDKGEKPTIADYNLQVSFGRFGSTPVPIRQRLEIDGVSIEGRFCGHQNYRIRASTSRGTWEIEEPSDCPHIYSRSPDNRPDFSSMATHVLILHRHDAVPVCNSPAIASDDLNVIQGVLDSISWVFGVRPFASAPVRSKPRRTYDPARPTSDPEGQNSPMYLANMLARDRKEWIRVKSRIESFGVDSGLFNEIDVRRLGKKDSEPFQIQVRKFGDKLKGPRRNLIDVGYGVSQVLPVITELLRPDAPPMFLLQQPEVHLHPSAQAALGSLFCKVAAPEKQLIVETHSDHLMDRVRMDVRDGVSDLKPEDVSILFFERNELDVRIHSLGIDDEGNIIGAPPGYRRFFMDEVRRSLWKHSKRS